MSSTDKLFRLIKSLTPAEKGFVKRDASLYKKNKLNNYVRIFDAIDNQQEYNESELLEIFKNESFTKNFSVSKNYLYQFILKSLSYHSTSINPRRQVENIINDAVVLSNKSLYEDGLKLIRKAKNISENNELFEILYRIINLENNCLRGSNIKGGNEMIVIENLELQKKVIKKMDNLNQIKTLHFKALQLAKIIGDPGDPEMNDFIEITRHPMISNDKAALSVFAHIMQLDIRFMAQMSVAKFEKAFKINKEILKLWYDHPPLQIVKQLEYMNSLSNHLICCYALKRFDVFNDTLKILIEVKPINQRHAVSKFQQYYNFKILYIAGSCRFEELDPTVGKLNRNLPLFKDRMRPERLWLIQFNLCILYLVDRQPGEALDWLNKAFTHENLDYNDFKIRMALLINLIVHYELRNIEALEHYIASTERKFRQLKHHYEFEKVFLKLIKKAISVYNTYEEKEAFRKFLEEFNKNNSYSESAKLTRQFDYVSWLESRIYGKSMLEIWKEKRSVPT